MIKKKWKKYYNNIIFIRKTYIRKILFNILVFVFLMLITLTKYKGRNYKISLIKEYLKILMKFSRN